MEVEILVMPGCASAGPTEQLVRGLLAELGQDAAVRVVTVDSSQTAQRLRFPGSPTVRVNGRDIEPGAEAATNYGMG